MNAALRRGFGLLLVVAWVVGCGDEGALEDDFDILGPRLTITSDSTAPFDPAGIPDDATPAATAGIVLQEGDGFRIEVAGIECAAGGNTVRLTSPESMVLTGNGCALSSGHAWPPFGGPYPAGTAVTFSFHSGYTGRAGSIRISGSYPSWLVQFEDGYDNDYNDIELRVTAIEGRCEFLSDETTDPNLLDPEVLSDFQALWEQSGFDGPDAVEMGGYIVEQDGELDVVPFGSNGDPQACSSTIDLTEVPDGATLVGLVHTHPHRTGDPVPTDGSCGGNTAPGMVYGNGPSPADLKAAKISPYPMYVIDPDEVHRLPPHYGSPFGGTGEPIDKLARNPDAKCR